MPEITYKNLHAKERRFPINGKYDLIGDVYFEDKLIEKEVLVCKYVLLKSLDQHVENYEKTEKLKLEREQMHADKEVASDNTTGNSP